MSRLEQILGRVRERLAERQRRIPLERLGELAAEQGRTRSLSAALRRPGKAGSGAAPLRVIGELKRRSPSAGSIHEDLDPHAAAEALRRAGCAAISVLTEPDFFGGSLETLRQTRAVSPLPLLRKDFILEPYQILEARAHGADAVLLLAAALDDHRILAFRDRAGELGMEVLVEAHGEDELQRLLALELPIVGCNARDLSSFEVDLDRALGWCAQVPADRICVIESGVREGEDGRKVQRAPVDAALVGEGLMRGGRIVENFRSLFGERV